MGMGATKDTHTSHLFLTGECGCPCPHGAKEGGRFEVTEATDSQTDQPTMSNPRKLTTVATACVTCFYLTSQPDVARVVTSWHPAQAAVTGVYPFGFPRYERYVCGAWYTVQGMVKRHTRYRV